MSNELSTTQIIGAVLIANGISLCIFSLVAGVLCMSTSRRITSRDESRQEV